MGDIATVLVLVLLGLVLVGVALRLRATPRVGGTVRLTNPPDGKRTSDLLDKALAASGSKRPIVSIALTTTRVGSGDPISREVITVDGQTYQSIDEIPPDVREHVREVLAKTRRTGSAGLHGQGSALARIQGELAELGLDLDESPEPTERPPASS
jgi:hypothetical protein